VGAAAGVGAAVGVGALAGVEATAVAGDVLSAGCDETARPFGATIDDPAPPLLHAATAKSSAGAANVRSAALHKRFIRNFLSAGVPKRESLSRGWESFPPAVRKDGRNKMGEREPHHIARCRPQPPSPRARCLNHPRDKFFISACRAARGWACSAKFGPCLCRARRCGAKPCRPRRARARRQS